MQLPDEKKFPACTHAPRDWTECARCIEDFYLEKLTVARPAPARQACAETTSQAAPPAAGEHFPKLRALVGVWSSYRAPGMWFGHTYPLSVVNDAKTPISGSSPDEALENVIIAALDTLEGQKAALEVKAGLLEAEVERLKKALLAVEREARVEAGAQRLELHATREVVHEAYAERNELAALVAWMARALGLPAGWRLDEKEEEDFRTLLFVELPSGQVSWHLADDMRPLVERLPVFLAPWDGHSTLEKRRRVREAIFSGFRPAPRLNDLSHSEGCPCRLCEQAHSRAQRDAPPQAAPTARLPPPQCPPPPPGPVVRLARSWTPALVGTAPKYVSGEPCWCSSDWSRETRAAGHSPTCERLTALLQEMTQAEGGQP